MNPNTADPDNVHKTSYPESNQQGMGGNVAGHTRQVPRERALRLPTVTPVVVYMLLAATILIYLLQIGSKNLVGYDVPAYWGAKVNEQILLGQFWRLFTPMFLHSTTSILHIGFNMYALYVIGAGLERFYGHQRFLILYLLAGFSGNVMSFLFTPASSLGSSTAIFGLLGAQGIFLYQNRSVFGRMAQRSLLNLVLIAVINLVIGMSPGIDNWGHVGGLIGGVVFAWIGGPLLQVAGSYPNLSLKDSRDPSQILQAHIIVAAIFSLLSAGVIFLM